MTGLVAALSRGLAGLPVVGGLLVLVVLWVGFFGTLCATARLCYVELLDGKAIIWTEAVGFVLEHLATVLLTPLVFLLAVILTGVAELLVLFLARIPILGQLLAAIAFLPLLLFNLLLLLVIFAGSWLLYATIATGQFDAGRAVGMVVRLVRRSPIRVVLYWLTSAIVTIVLVWVLVVFIVVAFVVTALVIGNGLGFGNVSALTGIGSLLGPFGFSPIGGLLGRVGLLGLGGFGGEQPLGLAQLLLGIAGILVIATLYALPLTLQMALSCAVYLQLQDGAAAPEPPRAAASYDREPEPLPVAAVAPVGMAVATSAPTTRFCTRCGRAAAAQSRFCTGCGAPM